MAEPKASPQRSLNFASPGLWCHNSCSDGWSPSHEVARTSRQAGAEPEPKAHPLPGAMLQTPNVATPRGTGSSTEAPTPMASRLTSAERADGKSEVGVCHSWWRTLNVPKPQQAQPVHVVGAMRVEAGQQSPEGLCSGTATMALWRCQAGDSR